MAIIALACRTCGRRTDLPIDPDGHLDDDECGWCRRAEQNWLNDMAEWLEVVV